MSARRTSPARSGAAATALPRGPVPASWFAISSFLRFPPSRRTASKAPSVKPVRRLWHP
jgi:hypothetical protein